MRDRGQQAFKDISSLENRAEMPDKEKLERLIVKLVPKQKNLDFSKAINHLFQLTLQTFHLLKLSYSTSTSITMPIQ